MGLDILPKSGASFRVSAGAGNFKTKLFRLTANRGSQFGNLRNNQKSIVGAMQKYAGVIKSYGGLNRLQQKAVIRNIKSSDRTLTYDDKRDLKKLVAYYSRGNNHSGVKEADVAKKTNAAKEPELKKARIVRDPNNNFNFQNLRSQIRPGIGAEANRAVSVAQTSRTGRANAAAAAEAPHTSALPEQSLKKSPEENSGKKVSGANNFKLNF